MARQELAPPSENPYRRTIDWESFGLLNERNNGTFVTDPIKTGIIFGNHGESFDPHRFPPIEGVWVQVQKDKKQFLYVDGHHRSEGLSDPEIQKTIRDRYPYFQPALIDTTKSAFGNPNIVPSGRPYQEYAGRFQDLPLELDLPAEDGPPALTMEEYMIALNAGTLSQERIAAPRSAAHLMQYWGNLLESKELAEKYSTLTAFMLLSNTDIRKATERRLEAVPDYLDTQPKERFFPDMSDDEHERIKRGIRSMVGVLRGVHIDPSEALKAAFQLVVEKPDAVGGEKKATVQMASMLAQREANRTGQAASSFRTQRQAADLRETITPRDQEDAVKFLRDPRFTLRDVQELVSAPPNGRGNRHRKYQTLAKQRNMERLAALIKTQTHAPVTDEAERLIFLRTGTEAFDSSPNNARDIAMAAASIDTAKTFLDTVEDSPPFPKKDAIIASVNAEIHGLSKHGNGSNLRRAIEKAQRDYAIAQELAVADAAVDEEFTETPDEPAVITSAQEREIIVLYTKLPQGLRKRYLNGTLTFGEALDIFRMDATDEEMAAVEKALEVPEVEELPERERYRGIPQTELPADVRARRFLLSAMGTLATSKELDPQLGINEELRTDVERTIVVLQQALDSLPKKDAD